MLCDVLYSIFMDVKCKPHLAVNLTKNYSQLLKNFVADSHNHDVCVSRREGSRDKKEGEREGEREGGGEGGEGGGEGTGEVGGE